MSDIHTDLEELVISDEKNEKSNLLPKTEKLTPGDAPIFPKSKIHIFLESLNTENNWALVLGISWYFTVLGATFAGFNSGHMFHWHSGDILNSFTLLNIVSLLLMMSFTIVSLFVAHKMLNKHHDIYKYLGMCVIIFISQILGTYDVLFSVGMGTAVWCIIFGIIFRIFVRDTTGFLSLDFYIKVSVVLLAVDMNKVASIGPKGLVVGWIETSIVFVITIIFAVHVAKVSVNEAIVTSGCLSICGSSAVIAINDVLKIDLGIQKFIISTMSVITIPYIPVIPLLGNTFHFNNNTIGAWIGGCIDTTGAVSASSSLVNSEVIQAAIIIKMIQNVWIIAVVIGISLFATRKFSLKLIWDNFPKFVLGFILTGLITTFLPNSVRSETVDNSFVVSEWFSSISFVIIGFEIDIINAILAPKQILEHKRFLFIYIVGQLIDTFTTLGISYLMFGL